MKLDRRNVLTAGVWAAGTLVLALGLFYPGQMMAVDAPNRLKPENAQPKLVVNGAELSATIDDQTGASAMLQPGAAPALRLLAANPTDKPVELNCRISLTISPPTSRESRMTPMPTEAWHQDEYITLKAGESKTLKLEPKATLAAGARGAVMLQVDKQQIAAVSISISGSERQIPERAAARAIRGAGLAPVVQVAQQIQ